MSRLLESEVNARRSAYRLLFELQSGSEPMIFGYQIGKEGLTNKGFAPAIEILTPEQVDQFVRGYAHAVAMADLDLGPHDPLTSDSARDQLTRSEELAYQYFKGVQEYRSLRQQPDR